MDALEFGIFESLSSTEKPLDGVDFEAMIADVQLAERTGHRYYFVIEHQSAPYPGITSPNVYLTAVARATSTIHIGAMVYQLPFHHPVRLAQDIATLDHLSKGRVEFGFTGVRQLPERVHLLSLSKLRLHALALSHLLAQLLVCASRFSVGPLQLMSARFDLAQHQPHLVQVRLGERDEGVDAAAGEERGVDLEGGIFGRRTDEYDCAILNMRQKRILLTLVEPMNFVDKQYGPAA